MHESVLVYNWLQGSVVFLSVGCSDVAHIVAFHLRRFCCDYEDVGWRSPRLWAIIAVMNCFFHCLCAFLANGANTNGSVRVESLSKVSATLDESAFFYSLLQGSVVFLSVGCSDVARNGVIASDQCLCCAPVISARGQCLRSLPQMSFLDHASMPAFWRQ